ncbi:DsbA family protein [Azospirillum sp. YIM DDC1]|uniref:DsbA family protein n=1 Tax=Azospirillum aestuarii TaxID=2802052 RepID=A0ABS1I4E5_9PROT|nr:DsbA family protein [Azospirillum aestuarii]MBK4721538.1 DsbA family protein [Azospirillum aestuarii]
MTVLPFNRRRAVALLGAIGLLAGAPMALAQSPGAAPAPEVPATATAPRVLGSPDAPIEVIEYASLTCHHCATFHNEVLPQVKKELIDTGKIRIVYRDFPLDRAALDAAVLARCVPPGRYFAILSVLFAKQDDWSHAKDPRESLTRYGLLAGLPKETFQACLDDQALSDAILQSRLDGAEKHQIDSTPSFVIDGKTHKGVLSYEAFLNALRPLLPPS